MSMKRGDAKIKCCGCKIPLTDKVDFYGTFIGDNQLTEGVCTTCYKLGIRTEAQTKAKKLETEK